MKKRNRMLSLIVSAAVVLSCCVFPASAAEASVTEEEMDAALRARGYPQTLLDHLPPSAKEATYQQTDLTYISGSIMAYDITEDGIQACEVPAAGIVPRGSISESDLWLVWSVGRKANGNIRVKFSYIWNNVPFLRLFEDPIYITWDEDLFEQVANSFYKVDKYDYAVGNDLYTWVESEATSPADDKFGSLFWYADVVTVPLVNSIQTIYGHGEFLLRPLTSDHGTTIFFGRYVRNKISTSLGTDLWFANGSVTGGDNYDSLSSNHNFYY